MDYRSPPPDAPLLVVGTAVTALDRRTGARRWTQDLKGVARKFALLDDRVFVLDSHGIVYCLDVQSGALFGKLELKLEPHSLISDGEMLYVSGMTELVALDRNGNVLWASELPINATPTRDGLAVPGVVVLQPDFADGR